MLEWLKFWKNDNALKGNQQDRTELIDHLRETTDELSELQAEHAKLTGEKDRLEEELQVAKQRVGTLEDRCSALRDVTDRLGVLMSDNSIDSVDEIGDRLDEAQAAMEERDRLASVIDGLSEPPPPWQNSVDAFVAVMCVLQDDALVKRVDLRDAYEEFCEETGMEDVGRNNTYAHLEETFGIESQKKLVGIRLKTAADRLVERQLMDMNINRAQVVSLGGSQFLDGLEESVRHAGMLMNKVRDADGLEEAIEDMQRDLGLGPAQAEAVLNMPLMTFVDSLSTQKVIDRTRETLHQTSLIPEEDGTPEVPAPPETPETPETSETPEVPAKEKELDIEVATGDVECEEEVMITLLEHYPNQWADAREWINRCRACGLGPWIEKMFRGLPTKRTRSKKVSDLFTNRQGDIINVRVGGPYVVEVRHDMTTGCNEYAFVPEGKGPFVELRGRYHDSVDEETGRVEKADVFRRLMREKGMSPRELSIALGLSREHVSHCIDAERQRTE